MREILILFLPLLFAAAPWAAGAPAPRASDDTMVDTYRLPSSKHGTFLAVTKKISDEAMPTMNGWKLSIWLCNGTDCQETVVCENCRQFGKVFWNQENRVIVLTTLEDRIDREGDVTKFFQKFHYNVGIGPDGYLKMRGSKVVW